MTFEGKDKFNASVNSTCAQPPRATAGYLPALSVPGVALSVPGVGAFANFSLPGGRAFANPGAILELSNTHAVSYQNVTTQRVSLEKKADWLISQGQE